MPKHLQRSIERLMKHLIDLSSRVEETVRISIRALDETDSQIVDKLYQADQEIDLIEIDIEEECLKIFALHQPVAIDLRYLVAVMKINNDLERIADLSVNIAEHVGQITSANKMVKKINFQEMSQKVQWMLKKSLDSLVNLDAGLAYQVLKADDDVDAMNHQICQTIIDKIIANPTDAAMLIQYIYISRHLERIADHATNIAEDLIYLTTGDIVRHHIKPIPGEEKESE
jgi:phosphate transport system protein